MCFLQQFLSHQTAPRISSLWPLHGQYFWLLSFLAEGKKDCAKGRDTSFLLPDTARVVEMMKNQLQVDNTTWRAELINKPATTSIRGHEFTRVCIETARAAMPQSFRNEVAVLRVLLLPTQIPLTRHVLIPTSCGYVGIGFYWLLPVPFSSKLPSSTRDPQLLPQEAAQEQQADRVTKASPLPQGGTTCRQFTGAIHTPEPHPPTRQWNHAEAQLQQRP